MNYEPPSTANVGESVPYEQISGVAVDLNGPVTPDAAALLQEIGASLPGENPFDDPPCLDDQGGRSSGKITILCPIIR